MNGNLLAFIGFLALFLSLFARAPIGLAMIVVGATGYSFLTSPTIFFAYMKTNAYHQFANYTLSVIPLFILMGALAEKTGIASALLRFGMRIFGRQPGGMALAVIAASTAFGAICGSSVATTATFGRAALPEFTRLSYPQGLACATIAAGGVLGILIPPSIILVVYAISTEQNIAKLFQAALIPGLLAAFFYGFAVFWHKHRHPQSMPSLNLKAEWQKNETYTIFAALLIAFVIVGGIYGGFFTPTEGAAFGVIGMLIAGFWLQTLDRKRFLEALSQTAETSAMIFVVLLGAEIFSAFLALSGAPSELAEKIATSNLPPYGVLIVILACYIALGAVMDELAMIMLTLPIFFPVIQALDFGFPAEDVAIWFGILVLIVVGIGLIAPPMGLNVFVISSIARQTSMVEIYRAVVPFVVMDFVRLGLVLVFPSLSLFLVHFFA